MDFGDILDRWEKLTPENKVYDKDAAERDAVASAGVRGSFAVASSAAACREKNTKRRVKLLHKKPDASIDLHGLSCEEAWTALQNFFTNSRRNGLEKVLIIHGKGNHWSYASPNAGALRDLSRRFIESCPFAGESGRNHAREGGTGATWVILK